MRLLVGIGKSMAIAIGAGVASLLLFSLLLYFSADPAPFILPAGLFCAALTAFIGGFAAGKLHRENAALAGLLCGSILMAAMLLLSLFFTSRASGYSAWLAALLHIAFLAFSLVGAALGGKQKIKKKKHRR